MSGPATRVVAGFHAVLARLRADPAGVQEIYLNETRRDGRAADLELAAARAGVRLLRVPAHHIDGLFPGERHQGVAARVAPPRLARTLDELLDSIAGPLLLLVLDGVTDPHNLGACLRTANAAGVHAVIAPRDRSAGMTATVSRVASGAAEATPCLMVTNLARALDGLKARNIQVVGTAEDAPVSLYEADLPEAIAWVLGAEGEGMRRLTRERCDLLVRVPMAGAVESLNVSVAAGVVLYETVRRRLAGRI